MNQAQVLISEVGPRDGLQSVKSILPTPAKIEWIKVLANSGLKEIEVGSFVSPKLVPQMADTAEVVSACKQIPELCIAALVPNLKGAIAAIEAGAHKISVPFSVSETHCRKNLNRDHKQLIEEIINIRAYIDQLPEINRPHFETSLSTAFGCTLEGSIAEDFVLSKAEQLLEAGADEVGLSDTTGYANPAQVSRMVQSIKSNLGDNKLTGVHLHNTRGLGLANAFAAYEAGINTFDSSLGGLGGCPFAPGASGNIVTEDLVFMFESMGIKTGISIDSLVEARSLLLKNLPEEPLYGFVAEAGITKGFQQVL